MSEASRHRLGAFQLGTAGTLATSGSQLTMTSPVFAEPTILEIGIYVAQYLSRGG
jgi:hypothetical protein